MALNRKQRLLVARYIALERVWKTAFGRKHQTKAVRKALKSGDVEAGNLLKNGPKASESALFRSVSALQAAWSQVEKS